MEQQPQNNQSNEQDPNRAASGQSPLIDENEQNQRTREQSDSASNQDEAMEEDDLEDEDMDDEEDEDEEAGMNSQADPARMQQRPQPDEF